MADTVTLAVAQGGALAEVGNSKAVSVKIIFLCDRSDLGSKTRRSLSPLCVLRPVYQSEATLPHPALPKQALLEPTQSKTTQPKRTRPNATQPITIQPKCSPFTQSSLLATFASFLLMTWNFMSNRITCVLLGELFVCIYCLALAYD